MKTLLVVDTETSSLDPKTGHLLEVAAAVWSVEHRALVRARSWLVQAPANPAVAVNGIPESLLPRGAEAGDVMRQVYAVAIKECDAIIAHNADFDRAWFTPEIQRLTWICSCDDIDWPRGASSRSLTALALAHGVGVADAHRALPDVLTMCRLLERAGELADLDLMLMRTQRPKARFVANLPREKNDLLKEHRFRWDPHRREWWRRMFVEDSAELPFSVMKVD